MKSMAIVIRDDSYDKILTPLVFAYLASAEGTQVDILFVNWAVKALTVEGAASLCMDGRQPPMRPWCEKMWLRRGCRTIFTRFSRS